jgi:hypothetical protein
LRDIKAGEELLDDYGVYEYPDIYERLRALWGENQDWITRKPAGFPIEYEVKETAGKGLGLFTKQFIPRGTEVWRSHVGTNMLMFDGEAHFREYLNKLPAREEREASVTHSYCVHGEIIMLILDAGKYMNHSDSPNTFSNETRIDRDCSISTRDIQAGEELTCDYSEFIFPEWYVQLHADYSVPLDYFAMRHGVNGSVNKATTDLGN